MNRFLKYSAGAIALSVLLPYIADRHVTYQLLYTNWPSKLQEHSAYSDHAIKFENEVRNCEDIVLDEDLGIAYFSCDPGRDRWNTVMGTFTDPDYQGGKIYYHEYGKSENEPIQELEIVNFRTHPRVNSTFHPLGLGFYKDIKTLYVTSHSALGPAIEVYTIYEGGTKAIWIRTLTHELMQSPNSILPLDVDEILFTNDHQFKMEDSPVLSTLETYLAYPGGSVIHLNTISKEAKMLAQIPFANGIARLNKTHIAVSSTTLPAVLIYEMSPDHLNLTLQQKLRPRFWADNLRVDANGKLLIAGHAFAPATTIVEKTNQHYDIDGTGASDLKPGNERKRAPSWAVEWDGNPEGKLRDIYIGNEFGTSTTAVRDAKRGVGFIGGLYEKGIYFWKE